MAACSGTLGPTTHHRQRGPIRRAVQGAAAKEVTPQVMDAPVGTVGPWGKYRTNMFSHPDEGAQYRRRGPGDQRRCRLDGAQADELPGARADLPSGGSRATATCPLRLVENGCCHRNEPHGASRADAVPVHAGRWPSSAAGPDRRQRNRPAAKLADRVYRDFGFTYAVQAGAAPRRASGSDADWDKAEQEHRRAVIDAGLATPEYGWGRRCPARFLCPQARMAPDRRVGRTLAGGHDPVDRCCPAT